MHRLVRILRVALPIAFVAFVILIALTYSGSGPEPRRVQPPETSTIRPDDRPQSVGYRFEDTQTVGGKVLSKIRALKTVGYDSGWYTLEEVELTIYRENGLTYQLVAPQAQFHAASKSGEVKKGVQLTSSRGITVQTEEMKFDGNRLSNAIPLTFSAQTWKGRAGGIDLNLQHESMRLVNGVEATSQTAAPEPPVTITAKSAEFLQSKGEATFRDDVVITRAGDVLNNQAVTAKLDQAHKVLVALEGCCEVKMNLRAGSPLVPGEMGKGAAAVTAERFSSDVGPQGEILGIRAWGAPARAIFHGPPERTLTATMIRIGFAAEKISELRSEGEVRLQEPARSIDSNKLTLFLDPKTNQMSSALAEENVRMKDAKGSANGYRANYDVANGIMLLSGLGQAYPSVTTEGHKLRAKTIQFSQKEATVHARGEVNAQISQSEGSVSASDTALFPKGDGPVFANSEELVLRQREKIGVFTGKVRAWQGNNMLFASTMQLEAAGESLNARGNVRALLYNVKGEKRKTPLAMQSDAMIAKQAERKVDLDGKVKIDDENRTLTADRATIFLDTNKRVDRVEADSNVVVTERGAGRKATGTHALYQLTEKMLTLDGSPAVVSEPRGTVKGKQIVFDIARNKVNVISDKEPNEATYHPQ